MGLRLASRMAAAVAIAAAVGAATASATAADRGWAPGGKLTSVDTTEGAVAGGLSWTPAACEGAVLWEPSRFARTTLRLPKPCPATSTGRGVSAVGLSGSRVVFLSFVGGNTREWRLWTVTPSARRPKLLRFAAAGADEPSPIVVGNGGAEGIPYAVGPAVTVLRGNGARARSFRASADVIALAEGAGAVAAVLTNGHVVVVSLATGKTLQDIAFAPGVARAARPVHRGVVVETMDGIELHRVASVVERFPVPAGAHLAGFYDGSLAYTTRTAIRVYDRFSRKDRIARLITRPVNADYDRLGLAWTQGAKLCWSVALYAVPPGAPTRGC